MMALAIISTCMHYIIEEKIIEYYPIDPLKMLGYTGISASIFNLFVILTIAEKINCPNSM